MNKLVIVNGIRRGMSYAAAFQWTTGTLNEALVDSTFPWGKDDGDWSELKVEIFDNERPGISSQTDGVFDEMLRLREEMDAMRARLREVGAGADDTIDGENRRLDYCLRLLQLRYVGLTDKLVNGMR